MYDSLWCCALSLYFSLSKNLNSDNMCFFARVIDDYVSRTSDLLCLHLKYTITEQGSEFMVVPFLRPLQTISRRKEKHMKVKFCLCGSHIVYIGHVPHAYVSLNLQRGCEAGVNTVCP